MTRWIALVILLFAAGCSAETRFSVRTNPNTPYEASVEITLR